MAWIVDFVLFFRVVQFYSRVDTTMHMPSAAIATAIATAKKVNITNLEEGWDTRIPILIVRVKKQQKTSECVYDK